MKKQNTTKLLFNKEKVANLSAVELEQVVGGQTADGDISTYHAFTCTMCTTISRFPLKEEE